LLSGSRNGRSLSGAGTTATATATGSAGSLFAKSNPTSTGTAAARATKTFRIPANGRYLALFVSEHFVKAAHGFIQGFFQPRLAIGFTFAGILANAARAFLIGPAIAAHRVRVAIFRSGARRTTCCAAGTAHATAHGIRSGNRAADATNTATAGAPVTTHAASCATTARHIQSYLYEYANVYPTHSYPYTYSNGNEYVKSDSHHTKPNLYGNTARAYGHSYQHSHANQHSHCATTN
jgi:hypothetical protein